METQSPATQTTPLVTQTALEDVTRIRLAEYQALRDEIINRSASQHQFLSLAIVAAGTLFVACVQLVASRQTADPDLGALLILGYPVLAFFLAAGWGHHDRRIFNIGDYISQHIEEPLGKDPSNRWTMGWEHHDLPRGFEYLTVRGIFLITEIAAILAGASFARLDLLVAALLAGTPLPQVDFRVVALLITALVSVALTLAVLARQKRTATDRH